jgi:protein-L-isoaspartate O-methyltransferase
MATTVNGEVGRATRWDEIYVRVETQERMMRWAATHHPMVVPLMGAGRVLEVGTGTGMLSGFLALAGVDVTTIDSSAAVLEIACAFYEQLGVTVKTVLGDGTKTAIPDNSFDAVFSQGVWEHFDDPTIVRFATEGLRLAPNVYASVPSLAYPHLGRRGPGLVGNERLMRASKWEQVLKMPGVSTRSTYYADWKLLTVAGVTVPWPNHLLLELSRLAHRP